VRAPEYDEWNELVKEAATSEGLAGIRPVATKTIAFMRRVQGLAPPTDEEINTKLGRTISAKNEDRLRQAKTLIDDILDDVGSSEEVENGTAQ
jgi:hypothetical protein